MIWVKLLFLLIFFDAVGATRKCAQCVAGDFLFRRNLMQDSSVGMSMGWIEEWKNTNCVKGLINTINCDHACLKITIVKHGDEENTLDGVMMDCSDFMIHASPDLPRHIDFTAYDESATFSSKRRNFTITYSFTMEGLESVENIMEEYKEYIFPFYREDYAISTILIFIVFFLILVGCICLSCVFCFQTFCCKKQIRDDNPHQVQFRNGASRLNAVEETTQSNNGYVAPTSPSAPSDDDEIRIRSENSNL